LRRGQAEEFGEERDGGIEAIILILRPFEIIQWISGDEYVKNFTNFSCQWDGKFISICGVLKTDVIFGWFCIEEVLALRRPNTI
jgi:hypothetical protein